MLNGHLMNIILINRDGTFQTKKSAGLPPIILRLVSSGVGGLMFHLSAAPPASFVFIGRTLSIRCTDSNTLKSHC